MQWEHQPYGPSLWPSVYDEVAYVPLTQAIHALDTSTGKLLQEYEVMGFLSPPPAVSDEVLYVGSVYLYAFSTPQR